MTAIAPIRSRFKHECDNRSQDPLLKVAMVVSVVAGLGIAIVNSTLPPIHDFEIPSDHRFLRAGLLVGAITCTIVGFYSINQLFPMKDHKKADFKF